MYLEQLNLTYLALEDRLLLRIGFSDHDPEKQKQEIQLYFTRRMVQRLWPNMMTAMTRHMRLTRPETSIASSEIAQMEYEDTVNQFKENGQFNQDYDASNRQSLNQAGPALIETIKFHIPPNAVLRMEFFPQNGGSIDIQLESKVLHGFCKLLQDAERQSEWGLELKLPAEQEDQTAPRVLN